VILLEVYGVIYGIENLLNHKIYVGQTIQKVIKRINAHKCRTKQFIDKEIQEHGWKNFTWTVLEECYSRDELDAAEKFWIEKLQCKFPQGYNFTDGGYRNFRPIDEVCRRGSETRKGQKYSQERRDNISKGRKGKVVISQNQRVLSSNRLKKIFYPNLEAEIEKQHLTHKELGRRLNTGIKIGTLISKLNGQRIMDLDTAIAIKEFLGVDMPLEELFKKKDDAN
jgi:group I intron endonuclease